MVWERTTGRPVLQRTSAEQANVLQASRRHPQLLEWLASPDWSSLPPCAQAR
jgi:hypothetical protein